MAQVSFDDADGRDMSLSMKRCFFVYDALPGLAHWCERGEQSVFA